MSIVPQSATRGNQEWTCPRPTCAETFWTASGVTGHVRDCDPTGRFDVEDGYLDQSGRDTDE